MLTLYSSLTSSDNIVQDDTHAKPSAEVFI